VQRACYNTTEEEILATKTETKDAWLRVGTARVCLLDIEGGFYQLRREIEALAGTAVAEQSLYAAGQAGGRSVFGAMLAAGEIQHDEAGFRSAVQAYRDSGFGQFTIADLDLAKGRALVACPDAFESWAYAQNGVRSDAPVCAYSSGVLATAMAVVSQQQDTACDEITCVARGDTACTFAILPAAESARRSAVLDVSAYLERGTSVLEERAKEAEILEQYRLLTENAIDMIFSLDALGIITFISKRVESLLGYRPQDLVGHPVTILLGKEGSMVALEHLQRSLSVPHYTASYELAVPHADGSTVYLAISVASLVKNGEVIGQQGIARDITPQVMLRQEVARRTQELRLSEERRSEMRDYVTLVTRVIEEERKRVARELHDDTAQALVALVRSIDRLLLDAAERQPHRKRIEEARALAEGILKDVRRFSRDLRPSLLDDLGLVPAMEWLTEDLGQQSGVHAQLDVIGIPRRLDPDLELSLFRIAQEALSNVRRHAHASQVIVRLSFADKRVRLVVRDDGVGFVPSERPADLSSARGLGIRGMRERAELIGGVFAITSSPGKGTSIEVMAQA
jgi:PAS domain S-box-containing protein